MKNEKRYPSSTLKLVTGMTSKSSKPSCTFCITYLNADNGLFSPKKCVTNYSVVTKCVHYLLLFEKHNKYQKQAI